MSDGVREASHLITKSSQNVYMLWKLTIRRIQFVVLANIGIRRDVVHHILQTLAVGARLPLHHLHQQHCYYSFHSKPKKKCLVVKLQLSVTPRYVVGHLTTDDVDSRVTVDKQKVATC